MTISNSSNSNISTAQDNIDYKNAFSYQALRLLIAGYKILIDSKINYSNEEEPNITGEIVRCANEFIDCLSSPDWTRFFDVKDELKENTQNRKGKKRKVVDIVCTKTGRKPRLWMRFEAKRLKTRGFLEDKYVGKTGLGEFIAGNYAEKDDTAGMIGYIQSDNCDFWATNISKKLNIEKEKVKLKSCWRKSNFKNIDHCYKTRHGRKNNLSEILIFHLLLDFTNGSSC
jgi:hypothetical protein